MRKLLCKWFGWHQWIYGYNDRIKRYVKKCKHCQTKVITTICDVCKNSKEL